MKRTSRAKRPSKRQVALLGIALAAVVIACAGAYFYIAGMANNENRLLEERRQELAQSRELAGKLVQCQMQFRATQAKLSHLEENMPTRAYVPTLLQQVETLAQRTNNLVMAIRPEEKPAESSSTTTSASAQPGATTTDNKSATDTANPQVKPDNGKIAGIDYDTQLFSIDVKGEYMNLLRFVEGLNAFPKVISVDSISISPEGNQDRSKINHELVLHIKMTAYLLKEGGMNNGRG